MRKRRCCASSASGRIADWSLRTPKKQSPRESVAISHGNQRFVMAACSGVEVLNTALVHAAHVSARSA
eukprot:2432014-Rhodomonas_salina.1